MARSISKKPKKVKIPNTRKSISVEERKIGLETTDWSSVPEYEYDDALRSTLRHYNYFYDIKDSFKWAVEWVKQNMDKQALIEFKASPERMFSVTASGLCKIMLNGGKLTDKARALVDREISIARQRGIEALIAKKDEADLPQKKTIAEIMKENTSKFIGEIEDVLDDYYRGVHIDIENYSVYNELKKIDAPAVTAKAIIDYYTPIRDEIDELINKKTPDLVEAYSHMKPKEKREYLKLLNAIIDDAEKYNLSKKAIRKTRAKKPKSVDQQVSKVKYLKDSAEYKLTSIDPSQIVGSDTLYMFNTKTRQLIYLTTNDAGGFKVQGTTIQNFTPETSSRRMIRKPDEFLTDFMKATKAKSYAQYSKLTTKPAEANGRINEYMILLKAYK